MQNRQTAVRRLGYRAGRAHQEREMTAALTERLYALLKSAPTAACSYNLAIPARAGTLRGHLPSCLQGVGPSPTARSVWLVNAHALSQTTAPHPFQSI